MSGFADLSILRLADAALQMSVQDSAKDSSESEMRKVVEDQAFVSSILTSVWFSLWILWFTTISNFLMPQLSGKKKIFFSCLLQLPGVDPNDPSVKDLLASLQGQSEVCLWLNIFFFPETIIISYSHKKLKWYCHVASNLCVPSMSWYELYFGPFSISCASFVWSNIIIGRPPLIILMLPRLPSLRGWGFYLLTRYLKNGALSLGFLDYKIG